MRGCSYQYRVGHSGRLQSRGYIRSLAKYVGIVAHTSSGAGPERSYVVKPADTASAARKP